MSGRGAFCLRFGRREGKRWLPIIGPPVSCGQCPRPVPTGEFKVPRCSLLHVLLFRQAASCGGKGQPRPSLLPHKMQGSQPRRGFSGLRAPASQAAKGCLPVTPASVHLAIHARPEGLASKPLSRPSFSRPHTTVCGPTPQYIPYSIMQ